MRNIGSLRRSVYLAIGVTAPSRISRYGPRYRSPKSPTVMTGLASQTESRPTHSPVMVSEVLTALPQTLGGSFVDCNLGDGGHARAILGTTQGARLLGIDLDQDALQRAEKHLARWSSQLTTHHGNFADLAEIVDEHHMGRFCGVLFDLGLSSAQLDTPDRGFSFRYDARLDMRFNASEGISAYDIVNRWPQSKLEQTIRNLGEEPRAGRVARAIVNNRRIDTTLELADIVTKALNWPAHSRQHPATRTFQALRMAVNGEIANLERGLSAAVSVLERGGRIVVISYHSVEDRVAKNFIRQESASCTCPPRLPECVCDKTPTLNPVNTRVIKPSISEVRNNPRARSARMRVAQRI